MIIINYNNANQFVFYINYTNHIENNKLKYNLN